MPLPTPNLDDRRFQQLVDEAKRFVQQRAPEWSDHNVSDPGVTLIEAFAHMVDQLIYRLNRVPEKNYLSFLDLIGIRLFPPAAARGGVTFWLSGPQEQPVLVPAGAEVATERTATEDAVVFTTSADLAIVPCRLTRLRRHPAAGPPADLLDAVTDGRDVPVFQETPTAGDSLLIGLSAPVPSCAVLLELDSRVEGVGVDPRQPPLVWEAWTGEGWTACDIDRDDTGGLNRPGDVILHVPAGHVTSAQGGQAAGWLRCRLVEPGPGQPFYTQSPTVRAVVAATIGGTAPAMHAETVTEETLGDAEGVPGQNFVVSRPPIVADGEPLVVETSDGETWTRWTEVDDFAASGPFDRHVTVNRTTGEVGFGPAVRQADGTLRQYGAVPTVGARVRIQRYRTGGGRHGNVARRALSVLRSTIPYISVVENRGPALGGVDGETVTEARTRGPLQLRAQDRAVTAADYELLARQAAPAAARVRCLPAGDGSDAGGVRLLVVPAAVPDEAGRLPFEDLVPGDDMLAAIAADLDRRRPIGARLVVEPPYYQGVTVVARLRPRPDVSAVRLRVQAEGALYRYLDPLQGGPDGHGWPFGRPVHSGEVFGVLQRLPGVEVVEEVRMFPADPLTGRRGDEVTRLELDRHALVFSHQHQVRVEER
ncbi:putative baseplate assembly protein [Actinoplanes utahensis]|uniref:Baseplate J family protein n=1 Tax=Actinoplanes utahensis TaxID=1869 RepID=A0A0A6UVK3_ACTUT|nr:putative baseplate assembly protein [Actinoplanes utahensis]KHD78943.1 baseplate J family protein [Actinoplanes utahensis]GIF28084.1 putative baseplate assembly protein [Actinoplanes utahensis]